MRFNFYSFLMKSCQFCKKNDVGKYQIIERFSKHLLSCVYVVANLMFFCLFLSSSNWKTKIILPLKEEMQHKNMTSRFHDIHPSLLMFLNRLHKIIIYDNVCKTTYLWYHKTFVSQWTSVLRNHQDLKKIFSLS